MNKRTSGFTKEDTLAIKGIAIMMMFVHHCFHGRKRYEEFAVNFYPFTENFMLDFALVMKACVGIFVFISAYGIACSLKKVDESHQFDNSYVSSSIARRIWKILSGFWPVYLVAIAGSVIWSPEKFRIYGTGIKRISAIVLNLLGLSKLLGTPNFIATWWYLSLAIMQIFLMPVLYRFYKKYGAFCTVALSFFLPIALQMESSDVVRWLGTMTLGIWMADKEILPRIRDCSITKNAAVDWLIKAAAGLIALLVCFEWKTSDFGELHPNLADGASPVVIIVFCYLFIIVIPGLRQLLMLLGRYSMNMFLIHNFIRDRWFRDFTYSFHYWWLIVLVLLADSLVLSMAIELAKKISGYQKLVSWGEKKIAEIFLPKQES